MWCWSQRWAMIWFSGGRCEKCEIAHSCLYFLYPYTHIAKVQLVWSLSARYWYWNGKVVCYLAIFKVQAFEKRINYCTWLLNEKWDESVQWIPNLGLPPGKWYEGEVTVTLILVIMATDLDLIQEIALKKKHTVQTVLPLGNSIHNEFLMGHL